MHRGTPTAAERDQLRSGFGRRLAVERRAAGFTQQQLAAAAGLHRNTITALETGRRRPTTFTTWALAKALREGERARVKLDVVFQTLAGPHLVLLSHRTRVRRERLALEHLAVAGCTLTVDDGEPIDVVIANLLGVPA